MAYTGTGTSADPYVVDNWADFVTTLGLYTAYNTTTYIKFADDVVIDMNDVAPEGISSPIIIKYSHSIDGNGAIIRNLYLKTHLFETGSGSENRFNNIFSFTNIHFLNIFATVSCRCFYYHNVGSRTANGYYGRVSFNGCSFSGLVGWNCFIWDGEDTYNKPFSLSYTLNGCSFNFEILNNNFVFCNFTTSNSYYFFTTNTSYDCQFKFRWRKAPLTLNTYTETYKPQGILFYGEKFINCYFCLDVPNHADNILSLCDQPLSYCLLNSEDVSTQLPINGSDNGIFIYNSTNFSIANTISGTQAFPNSVGVSRSDITNASYLRSLGFPIVAEE